MMMHYLNASGSVSNGVDLTVLERQRACMKWQQQQQQQQGLQFGNVDSVSRDGVRNQFHAHVMPSADDFVSGGYVDDDDSGTEYRMKKMSSCPASGRTSLTKKRKAAMKAVADSDPKEKKIKECAEDAESKITQQIRNSADSSKVSEVQKTDYIHVRARRGQATDSHSLAERLRREKIRERMKYLQELVPGCHKITGKAGMLDEIINYVQSLQRQVEFLSMKLATVNPHLNFTIESLFEKEVFQPSATEMMNPAYSQPNLLEEVISTRVDLRKYRPEMGLQVQLTETYVDTNTFNQVHQNYSNWDAELQNLYTFEFQATVANYPSQAFTGLVEANNLKMEI